MTQFLTDLVAATKTAKAELETAVKNRAKTPKMLADLKKAVNDIGKLGRSSCLLIGLPYHNQMDTVLSGETNTTTNGVEEPLSTITVGADIKNEVVAQLKKLGLETSEQPHGHFLISWVEKLPDTPPPGNPQPPPIPSP